MHLTVHLPQVPPRPPCLAQHPNDLQHLTAAANERTSRSVRTPLCSRSLLQPPTTQMSSLTMSNNHIMQRALAAVLFLNNYI